MLLDEMHLAPQAVLEGLNAVLDHRGSVYIPKLGRTFVKHPAFRIFAAQNPLSQGGGRKGLPKSFVNRFTKVYVDQLSPSDLLMVCQHLYPDVEPNVLRDMISFNSSLQDAVSVQRAFGKDGAPWEFNLRDVLRWTSVLQRPPKHDLHPAEVSICIGFAIRQTVYWLNPYLIGYSVAPSTIPPILHGLFHLRQ